MPDELAFVFDLALAIVAAFIGGAIAQRLGQPPILGYLIGGVLIGPFTPGPIADVRHVQVVAEIGVAFLMFALGAEFSFAELRRLGRVAVLGGGLQIVGTTCLGPLLAPALGLTLLQGVFLGGLLALSSTVVSLKLLMARGELGALHGRVTLGILVAQDIAVVPMVVVLPSLAVGGGAVLTNLGLAALKAGAILIGGYFVGVRAVPWLLARAAISRSRELFLLGVVSLALGTALVTQAAGLSLAFGAFLAGLLVAESGYRTQVLAEVLPLRDLFASLFLVSIGMLVDPIGVVGRLGPVALLTAVVVLGKIGIVTGAVMLLSLPARVALLAGLSLAQIGEFSFVLGRLGLETGAIPAETFDLMLATALTTIVLAPFLLRGAPSILALAARLPLIGPRFGEPLEADPIAETLRGHTVICGFGRVGRELAAALDARGFRYLVVEYNPLIVGDLRRRGITAIYGDASNPAVLEHTHLEHARLVAVLMPDANSAELTTQRVRRMHPRLDVVARAADVAHVARLRRAGATEVVQPEFEAGVEVIRHALGRYGVAGPELGHLVAGRRAAVYRSAEAQ